MHGIILSQQFSQIHAKFSLEKMVLHQCFTSTWYYHHMPIPIFSTRKKYLAESIICAENVKERFRNVWGWFWDALYMFGSDFGMHACGIVLIQQFLQIHASFNL